jgi:hypothetical protein
MFQYKGTKLIRKSKFHYGIRNEDWREDFHFLQLPSSLQSELLKIKLER